MRGEGEPKGDAKMVLDRIRAGKFPCGVSQPVCGHFRTIPAYPLEQIAELEDERDGLNVRCKTSAEQISALRADLALNASMLALQTDLAREAENERSVLKLRGDSWKENYEEAHNGILREVRRAEKAENDLAAAECILAEVESGAVQVNADLSRLREIEAEAVRNRPIVEAAEALEAFAGKRHFASQKAEDVEMDKMLTLGRLLSDVYRAILAKRGE